jgi:hypothetical protein
MSQRIISVGKVATTNVGIGSLAYETAIRIAHGTAPTANPFFAKGGMHRRVDTDGSGGIYTK